MAEKANREREVPKEKLVSRRAIDSDLNRSLSVFSLQAIPEIPGSTAEMEFQANPGKSHFRLNIDIELRNRLDLRSNMLSTSFLISGSTVGGKLSMC